MRILLNPFVAVRSSNTQANFFQLLPDLARQPAASHHGLVRSIGQHPADPPPWRPRSTHGTPNAQVLQAHLHTPSAVVMHAGHPVAQTYVYSFDFQASLAPARGATTFLLTGGCSVRSSGAPCGYQVEHIHLTKFGNAPDSSSCLEYTMLIAYTNRDSICC